MACPKASLLSYRLRLILCLARNRCIIYSEYTVCEVVFGCNVLFWFRKTPVCCNHLPVLRSKIRICADWSVPEISSRWNAFASFCPIPSVGDAVYFPGQSARPLTELDIRRTEGKIWCHCVCVFLLFLAHLLHILCSFASAWIRCGVWPWSANISDAPLHSCCTFSCENPTHQHLQCPSAPRCKVVAQASGLCGPRTNSVWCQCFGQYLLNAFCRSLQTASVSVQVTSLEPLSACIICAFAINLKRLHEVSRFVVKGLVWIRRRRNCFCWPSGEM